jgi:hypothetical protein
MYGFTGLRSFYGRSETRKEVHDRSDRRGWGESSNSVGTGVRDIDIGFRVGTVQTWTYDVSNVNAFGVGQASREMMHMRGEEPRNRQTQTLGLGSLENAIRGPSVRQLDSERDRY